MDVARSREQTERMPAVQQLVRSLVSPLTRTHLFRWLAPRTLPTIAIRRMQRAERRATDAAAELVAAREAVEKERAESS